MADYSKKVFEQGTAATEKLLGAKSFEKGCRGSDRVCQVQL